MTTENTSWHLDKKVPIGLIFALLVQTLVITSWGTAKFESYDNRLTNLEKSDTGQSSHENRITILEQQFGYIRGDLTEIKTLLQRKPPAAP